MLGFKVLVKTFLYFFKLLVSVLEHLTESFDLPDGIGTGVSLDLSHESLPDSVNFSEDSSVLAHLVHEIFGREHGL